MTQNTGAVTLAEACRQIKVMSKAMEAMSQCTLLLLLHSLSLFLVVDNGAATVMYMDSWPPWH